MNERIRQLMEQAGGEFYNGFLGSPNSIKFTEEDFEKFAKLIIQETMNVLHDNELHNRHISHVIREHFGVEE